MPKNITFTELDSIKINSEKDLVISRKGSKTFAIAQRVYVKEGGRTHSMFLRNSIEVDLAGLQRIVESFSNVVDSEKKD